MTSHDSKLKINYLPINELKPYERNARKHSKKQINCLAESIKTFGFNNPVLIDQHYTIIAGHARVEAAKLIGLQVIPTIPITSLTKDQVRAFILADNKIAELSSWDNGLLKIELEHLMTIDTNFEVMGFSEIEVSNIIGDQQQKSEEDETLSEKSSLPAVSINGDCWILGMHRIYCGDATKIEDMEYLMNGKRARATITDPPYNVAYADNKKKNKHRAIQNDDLGDQFSNFLFNVCQNILSVTDGAIYIFMSSSELHTLQAAFIKAGGHWSTFIIWVKNAFTLGRSDYQRQYEPMLYGWKEGSDHHWCGDRSQGDVWFYDKPARNDLHPTMKPIGVMSKAIRNSTQKGEIVLDPFLGSGTTLIAAERAKRICYGMELDPLYVDITVRRWQTLTGLKAIHANQKNNFDDMSAEEEGKNG